MVGQESDNASRGIAGCAAAKQGGTDDRNSKHDGRCCCRRHGIPQGLPTAHLVPLYPVRRLLHGPYQYRFCRIDDEQGFGAQRSRLRHVADGLLRRTLFEIPSNLALARFGARVWALVGAAEAGFLPGILLYLTYWFPRTCRARANALFVIGIPATIAIASTISGVFLQMDGFLGLAGWRWLLLLEGFSAVALGIVCLFYLDDGAPTCTVAERAREA
jgi:hypothetical protein